MTKPFAFADDVKEQTKNILPARDRIRSRNELTRRFFESEIVRLGWRRLHKNEVFQPRTSCRAVVIGTVPWNREDLDFLGDLAERAAPDSIEIYVFDLDDVRSEQDLTRFAPNLPLPTKTPVVAEYAGGRLQRWAEGAAARRFLDVVSGEDKDSGVP